MRMRDPYVIGMEGSCTREHHNEIMNGDYIEGIMTAKIW